MAKSLYASARVPVSLRLPADISEAVEQFAREQNLKKTDAYIYFLRKGVDSVNASSIETSLDDIVFKLDSVLDLLSSDDLANSHLREAERVSTVVATVASRFKAIQKAFLFGSFARGDFRDSSDIDIRLVLDRSIPFNLHDLSQFAEQVEQRTGRGVDIVSAQKINNEKLAEAIESDKILIYERNE